jgi:phosphopantothenoylcysteine decarboxylase/phosphopantothenate--cysteine ligase
MSAPGRFAGRLVALGVSGSIAAFKAVDLLRLFRAEGADVVVLMTPSATRFVAPLTLAALSRRPVDADVLDLLPDGRIGHVITADAADVVVVAPATAHWLGAMAHGLAADVVTATCLATSAPVVVAPAMDGDMYAHRATQENVRILRDEFGYRIVEPETGGLASGQVGVGRLAALDRIVDAAAELIAGRSVRKPDPADRPPRLPDADEPGRDADDLAGRHVVVTAGGTVEAIDPVRFIGNRTTGTMGVAVCEAARDRGARVTLVAGTISVAIPSGVTVIRAETALAMQAALASLLEGPAASAGFDALVMAAAVADFRPAAPADRKIGRSDAGLTLELIPNPDLLAELGRRVRGLDDTGTPTGTPILPRPVLVGFAAETGDLGRAAAKLAAKRVDLLVANDVSEPGSGFGTSTNRVTIFAADVGPVPLPVLPKRIVADRILDRVAALLDARDRPAQTGATPAAAGRSAS